MPAFRLRAKQIFITYPQANDDISINYLVDEFQPGTIYGVVARELHKDGNNHYHCALLYSDYLVLSRADHFDRAGNHPNVQGIRSWNATVNYCKKHGDFTEWGTDPKANKTKTATLFQHATQGTAPQTALREYYESRDGSTRGYRSNLADYAAFLRDYKRQFLQPQIGLDRFNACTIGNSLTFTFATKFKSKKLYIWGPPNVGKTTLINQWDPNYVFYAPDNNDWSGYDCEFHKIIVFDEFHGQCPLSTLLKLMQGTPTRLNTKGGSIDSYINLPMIFLSNIHANNCYRNSDAFCARLTVFYMPTFHSLEL